MPGATLVSFSKLSLLSCFCMWVALERGSRQHDPSAKCTLRTCKAHSLRGPLLGCYCSSDPSPASPPFARIAMLASPLRLTRPLTSCKPGHVDWARSWNQTRHRGALHETARQGVLWKVPAPLSASLNGESEELVSRIGGFGAEDLALAETLTLTISVCLAPAMQQRAQRGLLDIHPPGASI